MSTDGLKSLLDEMLADASASFHATQSRAPEDTPAAPPPTDSFTDVEQLAALRDTELCRLLALASRDDLLTVLAGASDGLRRRVLTNLAPESVRWLQQNLEYFGEPTRALLAAGRKQMLTLANRLLKEGAIELPKDPSASAADEPVPDELEALGGAILELLTLVEKKGPKALAGVASVGGDPMLDEGIAAVARGADERALTETLDAAREMLLRAYARRLEVIREGVLALQRGEDPAAFRARFANIGR